MNRYHVVTYMTGKVIVEAESEEEAKKIAENSIVQLKIMNSKTIVEKVDDEFELDARW